MKTAFFAIITALALSAAPARAEPDDGAAEIEAFMNEYLELWNAHDAGAITERIYRLNENHPWGAETGLQSEFDRLKAQGYDRSEIFAVNGCMLSDDTGQAELRYSRLNTDGEPMPPKDRASLYQLKKFADGWRVTGFSGLAADAVVDCPTR